MTRDDSVPAVIGISPFERPDADLVAALAKSGALGVLDLGRDVRAAEQALGVLARRLRGGFGVRIPAGVNAAFLPPEVRVVVVPAAAMIARHRDRVVLVQVTSLAA